MRGLEISPGLRLIWRVTAASRMGWGFSDIIRSLMMSREAGRNGLVGYYVYRTQKMILALP
jgi:hypothetical protein